MRLDGLIRAEEERGAAEEGTMPSRPWRRIFKSNDITALPSLLHRFALEYLFESKNKSYQNKLN